MSGLAILKTYDNAAERTAAEGEAQMLLLVVTENPMNATNVAGGSFSFKIRDNEAAQRFEVHVSGNPRILARAQRVAVESGWEVHGRGIRMRMSRRVRRFVRDNVGYQDEGDEEHPVKVNIIPTPKRIGKLTAAAVRRRGTTEELLANAARSVENVEGTAARARSTADVRRTPAYLAAAYGAAFAVLHQGNVGAAAGAGAGAAVDAEVIAAAALAASEEIIRRERPDLTLAGVRTLASRVLSKIQQDGTEPGPGERRQGGGRRTRRRRMSRR